MNKIYKSVLMGAPKISDQELIDMEIEIVQTLDSETRELLVPENSLEKYKTLVKAKLDNGYWNDIVSEKLIYFIFKMADGKINEYEYSENNRLEIAKLCSKLNHDPIEKTSDLLNYMAENEFYKELIKNYKPKNYNH